MRTQKINTGIYLPRELLNAFDKLAKQNHQSRNARLVSLIKKDILKNEKKENS